MEQGGIIRQARLSASAAAHLCVSQYWVCPLDSSHSQRESLQPPQQAAEVVVAAHSCCQGFLPSAGVLRGKGLNQWGQHPLKLMAQAAVEPTPPLLDTTESAACLEHKSQFSPASPQLLVWNQSPYLRLWGLE